MSLTRRRADGGGVKGIAFVGAFQAFLKKQAAAGTTWPGRPRALWRAPSSPRDFLRQKCVRLAETPAKPAGNVGHIKDIDEAVVIEVDPRGGGRRSAAVPVR